jgi:cell wall-associated NlpC family hydrolase
MIKPSLVKILGFICVAAFLFSGMFFSVGAYAAPRTQNSGTEINAGEQKTSGVMVSAMSARLLNEATAHIGEKYRHGGRVPGRFDCSGFVEYCYQTALGIIPKRVIGGRGGGAQYQFNGCREIDLSEVIPGDLVFFGTGKNNISHVGIFLKIKW